jgi:AraC-like DNA-binding protein
MKDRKRLIGSFILSYSFIWLPVLLICFIISEYMLASMRKKEEERMEEQTWQIAWDLAQQYQKYYENGIALAARPELLPEHFLKNDMTRLEGTDILKDVLCYNTDISDIFVYYGTDEIFSSRGLAGVDVYFGETLNCLPKSRKDASDMLVSDEAGIYFFSSSYTKGYLCCHIPIHRGKRQGQERLSSVNYLCSPDPLLHLLDQSEDTLCRLMLNLPKTLLNLYRQDGQFFIQENMGDTVPELQSAGEIVFEAKIPLKFQTEIALTACYRPNLMFEYIKRNQLVNYFFIFLGAVTSLLITVYLSRSRARRIHLLEKTFADRKEIPDHRDEYQHLRSLIRDIVQEADTLAMNESAYKKALLQQSTRLLFSGETVNPQDIEFFLRLSGVELCEEHYFVCGFLIEDHTGPVELYKDLILGDLGCTQEINSHIACFALIELPNLDKNRQLRQSILKDKLNRLAEMGAGRTVAAVSLVYHDIVKAPCAYQEALQLLQNAEHPIASAASCEPAIHYWADLDGTSRQSEHNSSDAVPSAAIENTGWTEFDKLLKYIENNYTDCNLTAERVADYAHLNKTYLSRSFKAKMNMTYIDYLTALRMKRAEELLLHSDLSIPKICNQAGYIDVSSFRKKFKKIYGMSASDYRSRFCGAAQSLKK